MLKSLTHTLYLYFVFFRLEELIRGSAFSVLVDEGGRIYEGILSLSVSLSLSDGGAPSLTREQRAPRRPLEVWEELSLSHTHP